MKYTLNGKEMQMDQGKDRMLYDTISRLAGIDPARTPTIMVSSKRGDGSITRGQILIVDDGMIITCMVTGSA